MTVTGFLGFVQRHEQNLINSEVGSGGNSFELYSKVTQFYSQMRHKLPGLECFVIFFTSSR